MEIFALIALAAWCMALSVSDIRSRRLPDLLTGPGAAVVFAYAGCTGRLAAALAGAALLAVPYLIVHVVTPAAFGAGDVKLAIGLGAAAGMCGGRVWVWAAIGAPLLTAVAGIAALAMSLRERGGPENPAQPDVPELENLSSHGKLRRTVSTACGVKRNFSFVYHRDGERFRSDQ
uniref:A24 family peptidase n=1 Tax=Nocardia cyriacigeorgica TaxID=135487 RepID=UPI00245491B8